MLDILEALGTLVEGLFGLRYLFSKKYRNKIHQRWKSESRLSIAFEIFGGIIAIAFLCIIIFVIIGLIN
jgi:hypothetical protein